MPSSYFVWVHTRTPFLSLSITDSHINPLHHTPFNRRKKLLSPSVSNIVIILTPPSSSSHQNVSSSAVGLFTSPKRLIYVSSLNLLTFPFPKFIVLFAMKSLESLTSSWSVSTGNRLAKGGKWNQRLRRRIY